MGSQIVLNEGRFVGGGAMIANHIGERRSQRRRSGVVADRIKAPFEGCAGRGDAGWKPTERAGELATLDRDGQRIARAEVDHQHQ